MNIFVGNLSFEATEEDLKRLFEGFGSVVSAKLVMEKHGKKSRGFGFVEMPDEQESKAAIEALNNHEFMGRALNVSPALTKPETKTAHFEAKPGQRHAPEGQEGENSWYKPVFNKKGGRYKTGRRSRSYMKRQAELGITQEAMPKREKRENPMRWRKKSEQPRPWQKSNRILNPRKKLESAPKLWKESEEGPKPCKKPLGEGRPWQKSYGSFKPWKKAGGSSKPWRKSAGEGKLPRKKSKKPRRHESRIQSRRKPGGYTR